jgi:hypothetical protein
MAANMGDYKAWTGQLIALFRQKIVGSFSVFDRTTIKGNLAAT